MAAGNGTSGPIEVYEHNWLYSVVPAGDEISRTINHPTEEVLVVPLRIYLAGYCRGCGKGFTKRMETAEYGEYTETVMDVPQYGCFPPKR